MKLDKKVKQARQDKKKARVAEKIDKGAKSAMKMKKNSPMKRFPEPHKEGPKNKPKKSNDSYKKALKNDPQLEKYIAKRKTLEKGTAAFGNNQYRINTAYYGKERADKILADYRKKHNLSAGDAKGTEKAVNLSQRRLDKLGNVDKKEGISEIRRATKKGEINENFDKKEARAEKKTTRRGKGDKKQKAQADLTLERAKLADLEGKRGGKKGVVLGKLRTKLAKKRVKKGEEKLKNA
tara:strand:+ start:108 stop:818 length:711 start_codon:yes stop_codon:yes gene_type:complete